MRYADLSATHECYDKEHWADLDALYRGGKVFHSRISRFLSRNDREPNDTFQARCREAHYRSYVGPIVDFFASFLFTASITIRAKEDDETADTDPFYADFKEDVDGADTDLLDFMRERMTNALIKGASYWLVEFPDAGNVAVDSRADWQERALGEGFLRKVEREDVLDFERDENGVLLWAIVHKKEKRRDDPRLARKLTRETWWLYDRSEVETFQVEYDASSRVLMPDDIIPSIGKRSHGCTRVPLVEMAIRPEGLWVSSRLASPQLEHFRLSCAQTWGIRRTCYAMPVFKLVDREAPPTMGAGYYLMIGTEEEMVWSSPPAVPFEAIAREVASQKDEIFRITHQMASGVDNNAAAVGRSGDSKVADAASTQVILNAYGAIVREAIEETYEILSGGRADDLDWSIEGMDKYDAADVDVLLKAIAAVQGLNIPSETLSRELFTKAGLSVLPDASQETKDTIREEIASGMKQMLAEREEQKRMEQETAQIALKAAATGIAQPAIAKPKLPVAEKKN